MLFTSQLMVSASSACLLLDAIWRDEKLFHQHFILTINSAPLTLSHTLLWHIAGPAEKSLRNTLISWKSNILQIFELHCELCHFFTLPALLFFFLERQKWELLGGARVTNFVIDWCDGKYCADSEIALNTTKTCKVLVFSEGKVFQTSFIYGSHSLL